MLPDVYGRAIVDDDDLIRAVGLGKDAFDCRIKVRQAFIDRDDDAD
jgi:queuine/archaeosine tRNA-ribosyltransferase